MNVREEVLLAVAEDRLPLNEAARTLGLSEAELARDVEVVRSLAAHRRSRRRRAGWVVGTLGALAMGVGFAGSALAAGNCAQTVPAPLVTFCSNTPALASEVNDNFRILAESLVAKVGAIGAPVAIGAGGVNSSGPISTTAGVSTNGTVSAGSLTVTSGGASVSGATSITGSTTIIGSATIDGGVSVTGYITQGCPTVFPLGGGAVDMVDMGAYCIQRQFDANSGRGSKSWFVENDYCVQKGLRMCSFTEVAAAARLGRITTYDFAAGGLDTWVWIDQTATDNNNIGFGGCHANLNSNKNGYLLGESNCNIDGNAASFNIGGLCCL